MHVNNISFSKMHAILMHLFQVLLVLSVFEIESTQSLAQETQVSSKLLKTFVSEFVEISPGSKGFQKVVIIGSASGNEAERPPYEVEMHKPFSISKYEVYQVLYKEVMGVNPSRWIGLRNSAERMNFAEAEDFCRRITVRLRRKQLIKADEIIRLPTEIEWEYCARAGTKTPYSFGKSAATPTDQGNQASLLDPYGWHTGNAAGNDPEVGVLKPNPWGLYDMHGYLSEFCKGPWKQSYADESETIKDAVPIRGGSWKDHYSLLTSSSRRPFSLSGRDDAVGFRCVLIQE